MTAVAAAPVRIPRATVGPIPLSRITAVELRKMFDTRSGFWLIASIAITSTLATCGVILWAPDDGLTYSTFATAIRFPVVIILPLIAILAVTSEWSQRTGLTTFTLIPHRSRLHAGRAHPLLDRRDRDLLRPDIRAPHDLRPVGHRSGSGRGSP